LADENHLPQNTVTYLHQLVGRAHNQLYRSRRFDYASWKQTMLVDVPQRIFNDGCVQVAFLFFWGAFLLSAALAASPTMWPDYAEKVLPGEQIEMMEESFSEPMSGRSGEENAIMASFYIYHNTGIGLKCFASGLLVIPGLIITLFNAVSLGAAFGYMARTDVPQGDNFFEFVTAHGPFELTAIVLSAGAGLRLGLSWLQTNGLTRASSLNQAAKGAMPLMGAAMILFFLAALIEGFVSPSAAPYWFKAGIAVMASGSLMFYFIILGYPRET
jgi:uncharacterized membrane protein SpoIIM required for sporulation